MHHQTIQIAFALLIVFLIVFFCLPFNQLFTFFKINTSLLKVLFVYATMLVFGWLYILLLFLITDDSNDDDNNTGVPLKPTNLWLY